MILTGDVVMATMTSAWWRRDATTSISVHLSELTAFPLGEPGSVLGWAGVEHFQFVAEVHFLRLGRRPCFLLVRQRHSRQAHTGTADQVLLVAVEPRGLRRLEPRPACLLRWRGSRSVEHVLLGPIPLRRWRRRGIQGSRVGERPPLSWQRDVAGIATGTRHGDITVLHLGTIIRTRLVPVAMVALRVISRRVVTPGRVPPTTPYGREPLQAVRRFRRRRGRERILLQEFLRGRGRRRRGQIVLVVVVSRREPSCWRCAVGREPRVHVADAGGGRDTGSVASGVAHHVRWRRRLAYLGGDVGEGNLLPGFHRVGIFQHRRRFVVAPSVDLVVDQLSASVVVSERSLFQFVHVIFCRHLSCALVVHLLAPNIFLFLTQQPLLIVLPAAVLLSPQLYLALLFRKPNNNAGEDFRQNTRYLASILTYKFNAG